MDNSIYRGILTGYNAAFIVDQSTRDALVAADPKSEELLKPILRGRDIARYRANWAGKWLISTFPSISLNIDAYPAIKKHLLSFGQERLAQEGRRLPGGGQSRKKTSNAWYELQDTCAYHEEFRKEKLFWMDLTKQGRFSYDANEMFAANTAYILVGGPTKFLCAVLNSKLATWFMKNTAVTSGMGVTRWINTYVSRIPIPKSYQKWQLPVVSLIDKVIPAINENPNADISTEEEEINHYVYELYDLSPAEIEHVSRETSG